MTFMDSLYRLLVVINISLIAFAFIFIAIKCNSLDVSHDIPYLYAVDDTVRVGEYKCVVLTQVWDGAIGYQVMVLPCDSVFYVSEIEIGK